MSVDAERASSDRDTRPVDEKIDYTGKVAAYIAGERAERLPDAIVERAKLHILDTIGAMLSGSLLKPGRLAIDFARAQGGVPEASVVATDIKTNTV